ncbi:hypothetical protein [Novosphingobium sp.]|uniref:tetratricopeptide repeat protein n=1 Tax=Novosphingobium sp. TaxID=1874826 RepID=UPI003340FDDE
MTRIMNTGTARRHGFPSLLPTLLPTRSGLVLLIAAAAVPALVPVAARADTAGAASETPEVRLRRIEGEMRALQRKVFPDGAGRTFAPQIAPGDTTAQAAAPSGNSAVLSDLMVRMDAIESQIKAVTATSEDLQNQLSRMDGRISAIETARATTATGTAAPSVAAADDSPAAALPVAPVAVVVKDSTPAKSVARAKDAPKPAPADAAAKPASANPSTPAAADHAAAIAAIERPNTDDKGEDTYTYGYRLWEAKFLPEAEAVLLEFVSHNPKHKRISYARNLLGRAYLDDNKPGAAAQWFVQNYQADKAGDRAADSLLYLAVAMTRLKEVKRACIALGEFHQTYPAESDGRLKGQYDAVTKTVACH